MRDYQGVSSRVVAGGRWRRWGLTVLRVGVLLAIAALLRSHAQRVRVQGERPITVTEVRELLPEAASLGIGDESRGTLLVRDAGGVTIGTALRSSPQADGIIGYTGPVDLLIVFADEKLKGIRIRHSYDTPKHVEDVVWDYLFMEQWNGMTWEAIGKMNLKAAGVEGVSGATRTSMCVAESLIHRLGADEAGPVTAGWRFGWRDFLLTLVVVGALVLAFRGNFKHKKRVRSIYRVAVFVYVGFIAGDLLAWSLFRGWVEFEVPYRTLPGLTLLVASALIVPAATGKPLYCGQICPHGVVQEWLSRYAPKSWRVKLPAEVVWALKWVPGALIGVAVATCVLVTPLDLASLEAFEAYLLAGGALASIVIAVCSLVYSAVVPMGYCKHGCPTGALLEYVRSHGKADTFGRRDAAALILLALVWAGCRWYPSIQDWVVNGGWF